MYQPRPEHKFTFGLWTVGNIGRDPFGEAVRERLEPDYVVYRLAELGAYGVNLHDEDLIPRGTPPAEREAILRRFKKALQDTGLKVPMVTANLFSDPAFKDGALTSPDPWVRAYALKKSLETLDLGAELGAQIYVVWPGREGAEVDATGKAPRVWAWFREALDFMAEYAEEQGYNYRFALEPKPNEPRGDIYLPTVGSMLALIGTLKHPHRFGLNPEFAHETMAGLNFVHAVAQAIPKDGPLRSGLGLQEGLLGQAAGGLGGVWERAWSAWTGSGSSCRWGCAKSRPVATGPGRVVSSES